MTEMANYFTTKITKKKLYFFLALIILLAFTLRIHDLTQESLWTDEAFSVHHAESESLSELIKNVGETEAAPPGYYVMLHYWVKIFGDSEFSIRFPSLIFGVLSVLILFKLAHLLFDKKVALLSSLLMATSMLQVLYSQDARLYSLFTLLTLISAYFFVKIVFVDNKINDEAAVKKRNYYFILYALSIVAAMFTNYLTLFLLVIYGFIVIFRRPKMFKEWLLLHLFILVVSLPLLPTLMIQYALINAGISVSLIKRGLPEIIANTGIFFFAIPAIIISFVLSLILVFRQRLQRFNLKLNDQLFFVIIVILYSLYFYFVNNPLSLFGLNLIPYPLTNSYFLIRHFFFLVPLLYLYLAYKIVNINSLKLKKCCVLFILLINIFSLIVYYQTPTKMEWKEAVDFIDFNDDEESTLVLLDKGGFSNTYLLQYYFPKDIEIVKLTWSNRTLNGRIPSQLTEVELLESVKDYDQFWLFLAKTDSQEYQNLLSKSYENDFTEEFYQIKVLRFVKVN